MIAKYCTCVSNWRWASAIKILVHRFWLSIVVYTCMKVKLCNMYQFGKYNQCRIVIISSGLEALYMYMYNLSPSWPKDQRIFHVCILYTHHTEVTISFGHGLNSISHNDIHFNP